MTERDPNLVCYGCCHAAAGAPHPGKPSGERPCHFCVRNPELSALDTIRVQEWYDHSKPVRVPMDCYHSIDMLRQIDAWEGLASRTKLTAEIDNLLTSYLVHHVGSVPSNFPRVMKLLESIADIEELAAVEGKDDRG